MPSQRMRLGPVRFDISKLILILSLLLLSNAFANMFNLSGTAGSVMIYLVSLLVFGSLGYSIAVRLPRVVQFACTDRLLLAILMYIFLSVLWSANMQMTFTRSLVFALALVIGFYVAARYSIVEQVQIYLWLFGLALLLSTIFSLLMPDIARLNTTKTWYDGAWLGVFPHKNALGRMMVITATVFLLSSLRWNTRRRAAALAVFLGAAIVTYLSRSATSALVLVFYTVFVFVIWMLRSRDKAALSVVSSFLLLVLFPVLALIARSTEDILVFFGRDIDSNTLSGRYDLWQDVFEQIRIRFLFGYGYSAYWQGWDGPSSAIWLHHGWGPNHAHNGFLDIWLELGVIGLGMIVGHILISTVRAGSYLRKGDFPEALWPISYLVLLVIMNLTYSILFSNSIFFTVLYVSTMIRVTYELRLMRRIQHMPHLSNSRSYTSACGMTYIDSSSTEAIIVR